MRASKFTPDDIPCEMYANHTATLDKLQYPLYNTIDNETSLIKSG